MRPFFRRPFEEPPENGGRNKGEHNCQCDQSDFGWIAGIGIIIEKEELCTDNPVNEIVGIGNIPQPISNPGIRSHFPNEKESDGGGNDDRRTAIKIIHDGTCDYPNQHFNEIHFADIIQEEQKAEKETRREERKEGWICTDERTA